MENERNRRCKTPNTHYPEDLAERFEILMDENEALKCIRF